MSPWWRRFTRARVLTEVSVVLGLGVAGGAVGALLAPLLSPEITGLAGLPEWSGLGLAAARGFVLGWFVGIIIGTVLAMTARGQAVPPPPLAVGRAGWVAALVVALVGAAGHWVGWPPAVTVPTGILAGVAAARLWLAGTGRRRIRENP